MELLFFIALWIFFAYMVAVLSYTRGRHPLMWFLLAMLFSPLLVALTLLCMANIKANEDAERRHRELIEATERALANK